MCSIDASKAFDRVNILLLFTKLTKRNFRPLFLRYLVNSYCNQMMMFRWNGSLSDKLTSPMVLNRVGYCHLYCSLFT